MIHGGDARGEMSGEFGGMRGGMDRGELFRELGTSGGPTTAHPMSRASPAGTGRLAHGVPLFPAPLPLSINVSTKTRGGHGREEKCEGNNSYDVSPTSSSPSSVPVYVMLPLDTVDAEGAFKYKSSAWFLQALQELINSGIHGVAVDVWWGAVEKKPRLYDFSGYEELFELLIALGLKIQVVLAFHACGGNVGDTAVVPLPSWVLACGERDPDIFFTDRPRQQSPGNRNPECISLFADEEGGILRGRSPLQCYVDFMKAFRDAFLRTSGCGPNGYLDAISEVVLGTGPCGELRYPSYAETNGWRFPGIGEFQCYDRRALASLASAAEACGRPEWGHGGPDGVGEYNSTPDETVFFRSWDGTWDTAYGRFFLGWYSQALLNHGERMLQAAASVFNVLDLKTPRGGGGLEGEATGGSFESDGAHVAFATRLKSPNSAASDRTENSESGLSLQESEPTEITDAMDLSQHGGAHLIRTCVDTGEAMPTDAIHSLGVDQQGAHGGSGFPSERVPSTGGLAKSRGPSYASFKSSASVSDGLNSMEEWVWPTPSGKRVGMNLKIAGVHWWYHTKSRPAELTAGYKGYEGIISLCAKYGVGLTLTCVEMCDSQHPPEALCGPEGLLQEVKEAACRAGVPLAGENALPCFMPNAIDESALQRIVYNTQPRAVDVNHGECEMMNSNVLVNGGGTNVKSAARSEQSLSLSRRTSVSTSVSGSENEKEICEDELEHGPGSPASRSSLLPPMRSFTFLRLTPDMIASELYQKEWNRFMKLMSRNALRFKTSHRWRRDLGFHHEDDVDTL